jgi:hypothetical protein
MSESAFMINVLASTTAGLISRFVCHPIDTCKSKLQATDSLNNIRQVVKETWKKEGIRGFYRGWVAVAMGGAPGIGIYLTSYEYSRNRLLEQSHFQTRPFLAHMISGMVAEVAWYGKCFIFILNISITIFIFKYFFILMILFFLSLYSCFIFIPVDVVKERLQVQAQLGRYYYTGSVNAAYRIYKEEGLRGLYKGYAATVYSFGPFSAIYFALFEAVSDFFYNEEEFLLFINILYLLYYIIYYFI